IDYLLEFIKMGALIQANYSSIKDDTLKTMLERNMVHILATDSHQSEWRSPEIGKSKKAIIDIIGEDKFNILSQVNPAKIIADEYIPSSYDDIKMVEKKKSIFNFWRKR